jgi:hypothetical protein
VNRHTTPVWPSAREPNAIASSSRFAFWPNPMSRKSSGPSRSSVIVLAAVVAERPGVGREQPDVAIVQAPRRVAEDVGAAQRGRVGAVLPPRPR